MTTIEVDFFGNGHTVAFDKGKQVPGLQKSWLLLFAEHAAALGYDPTTFKITLPTGHKVQIVEVDGKYNWKRI